MVVPRWIEEAVLGGVIKPSARLPQQGTVPSHHHTRGLTIDARFSAKLRFV
jgi:hypothetical protein